MVLSHNETRIHRYANARFRYATSRCRYAKACCRYANAQVRYATVQLRYANANVRYATARVRYAMVGLRYADTRFRYDIVRFRYACVLARASASGEGCVLSVLTRRAARLRQSDKGRCILEPMLMNMLSYPGPTSNTERQRQFRERNPGYYGRLHARRRAKIEVLAAPLLEAAQAMAVQREQLALPAPVETIEIPGMNTIPLILTVPAPVVEA